MKQWYKVEVAGRITLWWPEHGPYVGCLTDGLFSAASVEELEGYGYRVTPVLVMTQAEWDRAQEVSWQAGRALGYSIGWDARAKGEG